MAQPHTSPPLEAAACRVVLRQAWQVFKIKMFTFESTPKNAGICDGQRRYLHHATQVSAKAYEGICDEG